MEPHGPAPDSGTVGRMHPRGFDEARRRLDGRAHRTPFETTTLLGHEIGARLFFKCENLQKTGSFKVRGALNPLSQLDATHRRRGVVTVSAGNHAQAVYGVEPVGAAAVRQSLDAGKPVHLDRIEIIADGLATPMAGELTVALVSHYVDDVVTVDDDTIVHAMGAILSRAKLLTEPSGAAGTAGLLTGHIPIREHDRVVSVPSGGNIVLEQLGRFLATLTD